MAKTANRCKDLIINKTDLKLQKGRDKLVQEFVLAREDLQRHHQDEKTELISYYERRIQHLRRVIEKVSETSQTLRLKLDAEKEENFIMKVKNADLKREVDNLRNQRSNCASHHDYCGNSDVQLRHTEEIDSLPGMSSVAGLKYSDRSRMASRRRSNQSSLDDDYASNDDTETCTDPHKTCREEFDTLLSELRNQKAKCDASILEEREKMKARLFSERLQIKKVASRQLNLRLEKELKKIELIDREYDSLHIAISKAILDKIFKNDSKCTDPQDEDKECNSDSGAEVGDNGSDNGGKLHDRSNNKSRGSPYKVADRCNEYSLGQVTKGNSAKPHKADEAAEQSRIKIALQEQRVRLRSEYQWQLVREERRYKQCLDELNAEIVELLKENRRLKNSHSVCDSIIHDADDFHLELTEKLAMPQYILDNDDTGHNL